MTEPARHLADLVARAGQPVWLYRFSYVSESQRAELKGTLHGFEIPYVFDMPAALVGDKVTGADKAMGAGERLLGVLCQDRRSDRRRTDAMAAS
jgi:para-nitrobenzyl esterase